MLLAFLVTLGVLPIFVGSGFVGKSNKDYELSTRLELGSATHSIERDTAFAAAMEKQAHQESDVGFNLILGGLVPLIVSLIVLWWWLGARRRSDL